MDLPILRGRHVVLEPLQLHHAEELWPAASEHEIWKFMIYDIRSVDDLRAWIKDRIAPRPEGKALPFLQRHVATGQAFGSTSIFDISPLRTMEVGHTWIGRDHRRTAANTEAKLLVLGHCFESMGAIRVQLKSDERNERSRKAMLRIGARFEGILRHQLVLPDGHKRNAAIHSILDSEWPAVKARLEDRLLTSRV